MKLLSRFVGLGLLIIAPNQLYADKRIEGLYIHIFFFYVLKIFLINPYFEAFIQLVKEPSTLYFHTLFE